MNRFNQMAIALKAAKVRGAVPEVEHAEDVPEASAGSTRIETESAGSADTVREDRTTVGDRQLEEPERPNVRRVQKSAAPRALGVVVGECSADADWMKLGRADQISLCPTFWDAEIAKMRAMILKKTFIREGRERILLLGTRVTKIWRVGGRSRFGICKLLIDGASLNVAWIPHPKKLTEYVDQLEATPYIEWVTGERDM